MDAIAHELLEVWFSDWTDTEPLPDGSAHMRLWWSKDPATDAALRERFAHAAELALAGELDHWRTDPRDVVALVLLLDQIPRNIHRDTRAAFGSDARAREVCKGAIAAGLDEQADPIHRYFLYMPLMHSEEAADHDLAVERFSRLIDHAEATGCKRVEVYEQALHYEQMHRSIIDRFGRYPHRNRILGRESTPEERDFLKKPGSSF